MWKTTNPDAVGLYVASAARGADSVRFWTGKHWTAPCMVRDLHLAGRVPQCDWPPAAPARGDVIEWLEPVAIASDGFVSWGGLLETPLRCEMPVIARLGTGEIVGPRNPSGLSWLRTGESTDIVAYRPFDIADRLAAPANDDRLERRASAVDRRAGDCGSHVVPNLAVAQ